jgi:hypothetical protein
MTVQYLDNYLFLFLFIRIYNLNILKKPQLIRKIFLVFKFTHIISKELLMHIYCIFDHYNLNANIWIISILKKNHGIFNLHLLISNCEISDFLSTNYSSMINSHNSSQFLQRTAENFWKPILVVTKDKCGRIRSKREIF